GEAGGGAGEKPARSRGEPETSRGEEGSPPATTRNTGGLSSWKSLVPPCALRPRLGDVLTRIDLRGSALKDTDDPRRLLPRAALDVNAATDAVKPVVEAIREHGAPAIREATLRFDGVALGELRVPVDEVRKAVDGLDP